jgi:hypothetical protein
MGTKKFSTSQLVGRWEDQRDIKNLMGKYANCIILNRESEIYDLFWAKDKEDVCLGFNAGWYKGGDVVAGYYAAVHDRNALVASLLQKKFPEELGKKSAEEIYGIGPFKVLPVACPVIEVSEDDETAKGLFYCQGASAEIHTYGPSANWSWGYYAVDFVREGNEWKIWHMQYVNDIDSRCGYSWGKPLKKMPDLPEFAPLKDFKMPPYTVKTPLRELYHPKRPLAPAPELPMPYTTFSETFSYGI